MRYQPTQLALLISLIGVSGTSYAFGEAAVNEPARMGVTLASETGLPADASLQAAARIDAATRARAIAAVRRATQESDRPPAKSASIEPRPATWLQAYRPGNDALDDFVATFVRAEDSKPPSQVLARQPMDRSAASMLASASESAAPAPSTLRAAHATSEPTFATISEGSKTHQVSGTVVTQPSRSALATAAVEPPSQATVAVDFAVSNQAARVMDSLAAIVLDDMTVLGGTATHKRIAERFPGWIEQASASAADTRSVRQTPVSVSAEPRRVLVGTQSTKVMSNLQSVLTRPLAALPSLSADAPELVVASQLDKVLASLSDVRERSGDLPAIRAPRSSVAMQTPPAVQPSSGGEIAQSTIMRQPKAQPEGATAAATSALASQAVDIALDFPAATDLPATVDIDLSQPMAMDDTAPGGASVMSIPASIPASISASMPASLPSAESNDSPFGDTKVAVSETSLDGVRGGFVSNGLNISFGVERAVYQNGALVSTTSLNMSELGKLSAGTAAAAVDKATLTLVQSGSGNSFTPSMSPTSSFGTVLQNTLDGQKIQSMTVINATANSINVLRGLDLQSSLRSAVIDSLRR